jgi:thiol-disulfide isomerase/thioredoxin
MENIRESANYFDNSKFITELTHLDFDPIATWKLKNSKGCSVILFYAPWCYYCKKSKSTWENLGRKASFIKVYAMNCEKNSSHCQKIREDTKDLVKTYPSMIIYIDGSPVEKIGLGEDDRTLERLIQDCKRVCSTSNKVTKCKSRKCKSTV